MASRIQVNTFVYMSHNRATGCHKESLLHHFCSSITFTFWTEVTSVTCTKRDANFPVCSVVSANSYKWPPDAYLTGVTWLQEDLWKLLHKPPWGFIRLISGGKTGFYIQPPYRGRYLVATQPHRVLCRRPPPPTVVDIWWQHRGFMLMCDNTFVPQCSAVCIKDTGFPLFSSHKFPWLFPDFSSIFFIFPWLLLHIFMAFIQYFYVY